MFQWAAIMPSELLKNYCVEAIREKIHHRRLACRR